MRVTGETLPAVRGPEKQMTTASETQATMTHNAELEGDPRAPAFNWHTLQANHSTERLLFSSITQLLRTLFNPPIAFLMHNKYLSFSSKIKNFMFMIQLTKTRIGVGII